MFQKHRDEIPRHVLNLKTFRRGQRLRDRKKVGVFLNLG